MPEIKPDTPHPMFAEQDEHYQMVGDFYRGVGKVREAKETYLPKTAGMINAEDAKKADDRYKSFLLRATYPGLLRHTVSSIVGVSTGKEPQEIKLPASWASVEECATREGDSLRGLQAIAVRAVSKLGRIGLLTDMRSDTEEVPVIVPFTSNQIINWRTSSIDGKIKPTLLVLKKIESVEAENYWEDSTRQVIEAYSLTKAGVVLRRFEKQRAADGKADEWAEVSVAQPRRRSQANGAEAIKSENGSLKGFRLDEIPFTSITPMGLHIDPVDPPFLDLVHKLKDIYIGSANYREALSMYEPTPVINGMTEEWIEQGHAPKYMGVGNAWLLPEGSQATMLEYRGDTIKDIRQALIDDAKEADRLATQPFEQITAQVESGEAKKEKSKSKTNVIREIHSSAGQGIQEALRKFARWTGINEDEVVYSVSDELDDGEMSAADLRENTAAWISGAIPDSDMHRLLKSGGKTSLTFEEWKAERDGGESGATLPSGARGAFNEAA